MVPGQAVWALLQGTVRDLLVFGVQMICVLVASQDADGLLCIDAVAFWPQSLVSWLLGVTHTDVSCSS